MSDCFENTVKRFYNDLVNNENHRFKSWEYCFINFQRAFNKSKLFLEEKDLLSLHLAFYLASWGMYRGSSFLLQKDYKVFYPIIELLLEYKNNFNHNVIEDIIMNHRDEAITSYVSKYFLFDKELSDILLNIRNDVHKCENKEKVLSDVSYTLKTKIILGTYGSIPAYDRFFQDGLRLFKDSNLTVLYSSKGVEKIILFSKRNIETIMNIKKEIINVQDKNDGLNKVDYPIMKIIDMFFWKMGYELSKNNKNKTICFEPKRR
jgi:hypothetical protein